ncbi:uncharacterized protein UTRI_10466_B [Ustilago trichophora]|uniref:Apple domain-containing protein n=1 Tax=Ustilago trichophora TaxID=86804 RepID=A0A5C3E8E5_9BASI|nr:uncharacterized protein UTRI_10466_B [Ustilago trichophora]
MSDVLRERNASSHVVLTYKDNEEDEDDKDIHPHSSLLPTSTNLQPASSKRRSCWKRIVLFLAIIAMCVGIFELAFHGKEAESLAAAKAKIGQLENELRHRLTNGFNRVMTTMNRPPTPALQNIVENTTQAPAIALVEDEDPDVDAVKRKTVIVLKTGASVLFDRLPVQLLQAQSTLDPQIHLTGQSHYLGPSLFVYSDADIQLGPFSIHNALANVSTFVRNEPIFSSRYSKLQAVLSAGEDLRASAFQEGWNLDKWKFLYMWEDAFRRNPDAEWYIGYEADTFVLWRSLFKYLATQDSGKEQIYGCGSILLMNNELFANGGCPYVISGSLMRATYGKDPNFASKFDKSVKASCCGDAELSIALRKSATVPIRDLSPAGARFQGDRPREVLYSGDNWCEPVFSFHHLKTEEVQHLAQIERDLLSTKNRNTTILYSDIFDHILPQSLSKALLHLSSTNSSTTTEDANNKADLNTVELNPTQEDWEAFGSEDKGVRKGRRHEDSRDCQKQCLDSKGCTSWFWIKVTEQDPDGDCYLMHDAVKIGKTYEGTGLRTSGWIAKRIASFKAHHYCKDPPAA